MKIIKYTLVSLFVFIIITVWRICGVKDLINNLSDEKNDKYNITKEIEDFSGMVLNYKCFVFTGENTSQGIGINKIRTLIIILDENNEIIFFKRDVFWGETDLFDYAKFHIKDNSVVFFSDVRIPLSPSLYDRIDAKIISFVASLWK